jgi:hypothetical protein
MRILSAEFALMGQCHSLSYFNIMQVHYGTKTNVATSGRAAQLKNNLPSQSHN